MEKGITKQQLIAELTRSSHGDLKQYVPLGTKGSAEDPEFFSHMIAWNNKVGQIRDSRVALPVIALTAPKLVADPLFLDNALAHLASLDPRNFVRALDFARDVKPKDQQRRLRGLVERYLRVREDRYGWWERSVLQHRGPMKTLYARYHVKPAEFADKALFKGKPMPNTTLAVVKQLGSMPAREAAAEILRRKIPFLVATSIMGEKLKDPDVLLAVMETMSPAELLNNAKMLEKLGVMQNRVLKTAYDQGLKRAVESNKVATLKAAKAAEQVTDKKLKEKLKVVQEKKLEAVVDGDWLVLADKSSSMSTAVEASRHIAAILAKAVKGKVHLVFFDSAPRYFDATGKTYEELYQLTRAVTAHGNTSIGCGVRYCQEKGLNVDGIALVSDGEENTAPMFSTAYASLSATLGKEPPVYYYKLRSGSSDVLVRNMAVAQLEMQVFDLSHGQLDYYSLPNLVLTMNTRRYGLVDQIMEVPLLTLDGVFATQAEALAKAA